MKCKNCSYKNDSGSIFCAKCGYPLKKKSKKKWIILSAIMVAAILAGGLLWFFGSTNAYEDQINVGYELMNNHKYEEAILAFDKAIKIEPKKPDGYVGKAKSLAYSGADTAEVIDTLDEGYICTGGHGAIADVHNTISEIYIEKGDTESANKISKHCDLVSDATCGYIRDDYVLEVGTDIISLHNDGIYMRNRNKDNDKKIIDGQFYRGIISDGKVLYFYDNNNKQIKKYTFSNDKTELMADLSKEFKEKTHEDVVQSGFGADGTIVACSDDYLYFNAMFGPGDNNTYTINTQTKEWKLAWQGGAGFFGFYNNKAYFTNQVSVEGVASVMEADLDLQNSKVIEQYSSWYGKMIGNELYHFAYYDDSDAGYAAKYNLDSGEVVETEHLYMSGYADRYIKDDLKPYEQDIIHYMGGSRTLNGVYVCDDNPWSAEQFMVYNELTKMCTLVWHKGFRDFEVDLGIDFKSDAIGVYDNCFYYWDANNDLAYVRIINNKVSLTNNNVVAEKREDFNWKNEYTNVLNNTNYSEYTLYDIDKDNIPELVLNDHKGNFEFQVYGIKNNELIDYGVLYASYGIYSYSENGIIVTTGGTGVLVCTILQIQNNSLLPIQPDLLQCSVVPSMQYEDYLFQGQPITASEYEEKRKEIFENSLTDFYTKTDLSIINNW